MSTFKNMLKALFLLAFFVGGQSAAAQTVLVIKKEGRITLEEQQLKPLVSIEQDLVFVSDDGEVLRVLAVGGRERQFLVSVNQVVITLPATFDEFADSVVLSTIDAYKNESSGCLNVIFDLGQDDEAREGTLAVCAGETGTTAAFFIDGERLSAPPG